ncbi:MAG TPA: copper-binding protein [Candidatus Acidoferrales bacterium]|nr:copper-binding protein [Candidatus Acidoferrales bacterium]
MILILAAGISFSMVIAGCSAPKPAQSPQAEQGPRRYRLAGRVVSVNTATQQVVIDHGDIPGFMSAMTMGYPVKNPDQLMPLAPEDQITADVVVNGDDVHLENIVVVKKAAQSKAPAGKSQPAPSQPGKQ